MVRARLKLLLLIIVLPALAVLVRLAWLQLHPATHRHYHALSEHRTNIFSAPMRGRIFSRDGELLAGNRPVYRLTFHYPSLNPRAEPLQAIVDELQKRFSFPDVPATDSRLLELASPRELAAEAPGAPSRVPEWIPFVEGLDFACAASLKRRLRKHGQLFEVRPSQRRGLSDLHVNPRRAAAMEVALHRLAPFLSRGAPPGLAYEALREKVASELERIRLEVEKDVRRERDENENEKNIRVKNAREEYIRAKMRSSRRIHLASTWVLAADVPPEAVTEVEYHPELYPGIQVEDGIRRIYPLREAAGTLTGHMGKLLGKEPAYRESGRLIDALHGIVGEAAFEEARDGCLRSTDLIGTGGIEEGYDADLRGLYGLRVMSVDMIHQPKELLEDLPPVHGEDIRTTIDASLQTAVYEALRDGGGPGRGPFGGVAASAAVMSLDPSETGALLASAGFPGVDPNRLTETPDAYLQELEGLWEGKSHSWLFDRPSRLPLHPGSIFKIVVAAAALESASPLQGVPYDPSFAYECRGEFHLPKAGSISCNEPGGHGPLDLPASLGRSCNSYFYYLGSERLGAERLHDWGDRFGFGRSPEIDLAGPGSAGRLASENLVGSKRGICEYSIGQSFVEATPIQVLRCVAAVALRGASLPRPYVVRPRTPAGTIPLEDPRAWDAIRDGLWRAGHDPGGTAARPELGLHRYNAAYKTGTAEVEKDSVKLHQAWIAGFAPFDRPRIAFVAVVEQTPLHGGEACAPIVRRILEHFARSDPRAYLIEGEPQAISGAEAPAR